MDVLLVTPWPPTMSGVANYSMKLFMKLSKHIRITLYIVSPSKSFLKNIKKIMELLLISRKYRIVHLQLESTYPLTFLLLLPLMAKMLNVRKVLTMHSIPPLRIKYMDYADNMTLAFFLRYYLSRLLAIKYLTCLSNSFDCIIVHSMLMKQYLASCGVKEEKIIIIPHGTTKVKVENIVSTDMLLNREKNKVIIIFLGFLRPSKGIKYLLEALNLLEQDLKNRISVKIIGGYSIQSRRNYNSYLKDILRIIKKDRLESIVEIINRYVPQDELKRMISQADIIVLPYIDEFVEVSGIIHEVADYQKPVIVTSIPKFISELTDGENCLMVRPKDPRELAKAMEVLVKDSYLRKKLGENLKKLAKQTYWCIVSSKHLSVYKELLN
ncbi:MAG: glycosyltransferase [Ignisphaera sp.]